MAITSGVRITLTGVDGSRWDLHSQRDKSVFIEQGGVGDLFDAPATTSYKPRVGQSGSTFTAARHLERHLALPITVHHRDRLEWARLDSDFRRAFSYTEAATLTVETDMSGARQLRVRLAEQPQYRGEINPNRHGVSQWLYPLVAANPMWESEQYHDEFVFDGLNWFSGSVEVSNPTDQPAWPKWVLSAPAKFILPDVSFRTDNHADRMIDLPFQPLGREVVVDTDPLEEMIVANDATLLWAHMEGQFFSHPIPPHTPPTTIPVAVDPLPHTGWVVPTWLKKIVATEVEKWARALGLAGFFAVTPQQMGQKIREIILALTPDVLERLSPTLIGGLLPEVISEAIVHAYGSVANMAGATAQIRINRQWSRPWGLE